MTEPEADWARLGRYIKARMEQIGATPELVNGLGGPKPTKLRELANGRATTLRSTLRPGLEKALQWSPGDIGKVLRGGEPTSTALEPASRQLGDNFQTLVTTVAGIRGIGERLIEGCLQELPGQTAVVAELLSRIATELSTELLQQMEFSAGARRRYAETYTEGMAAATHFRLLHDRLIKADGSPVVDEAQVYPPPHLRVHDPDEWVEDRVPRPSQG